MKKRKKNVIYCIAYMVLWVVFRIVMPTRCINKQNRPEGGALLCANHTRTNDPLFIAYALGWHYQIHVMAKEEIMHWPLIGWVLKHGGIFGVKRGKADVAAIKTANSAMPRPARPCWPCVPACPSSPSIFLRRKSGSAGIPSCSARHTILRHPRGVSPRRRTTTRWPMI